MVSKTYRLTVTCGDDGCPVLAFEFQNGDGEEFFEWMDDGDSFLSTVLSTDPRSLLDESGVPCAPCTVQLDVYGHYQRGDGWETDDDWYTESVFSGLEMASGEPFATRWADLAPEAWKQVAETYEVE